MHKIIVIGESTLRVDFKGTAPVASYPSGVLLSAAARLASLALPVSMVSEVAADPAGDIICDFLRGYGVDTHSVDRFTGGSTQVELAFADGRVSRYGTYHDTGFTVVWPRIDPDDILIFGGYYALDPRARERLFELVSYAHERSAVVVYVPDFDPARVRNITHVMPAILENFEVADIAVVNAADLSAIFRSADAAQAYREHVGFYVDRMLNLDPDGALMLYHGQDVPMSLELDGEMHGMPAFDAPMVRALVSLIKMIG